MFNVRRNEKAGRLTRLHVFQLPFTRTPSRDLAADELGHVFAICTFGIELGRDEPRERWAAFERFAAFAA